MNHNTIIVKKPYIVETEDQKARLNASINGILGIDQLFFEVEVRYVQYLDTDVADAFLLMLLEYAMINNCDLCFEAPITTTLLDYVNEYYIPLLAENVFGYNRVKIVACPKSNNKNAGQSVGTGFSAGIDSFYTVFKQLETQYNELKLTHVVFANVGAQTYSYDESSKIFPEKAKRMRRIISEVESSIEFIAVDSNCLEVYKDTIGRGFTGPDAKKTCSCVVALKKLFSTYYFSNGPTLDRFKFSSKDPAHYDLFTIDMLNKTGITFYSKGIETPKRIDKLKYIADRKQVQQNLSVCIDKNCGICEKCVRTELELWAINKLEDFASVFDVLYFKKNFVKIAAKYLAIPEERHLGFVDEIVCEARKHRVSIPMLAYIFCFLFYRPLYLAKKIAKRLINKK